MSGFLVRVQMFCLLIVLFQNQYEGKTVAGDDNTLVQSLSNGAVVHFRDKNAYPVLSNWANELSKADFSATHDLAMNREAQVVHMVNSGQWSIEAYDDYQRLVAGTGNVDSARLMLEYSIRLDVYGGIVNPFCDSHSRDDDCKKISRQIRSLHASLLACDSMEFISILNKLGVENIQILRLSAYATTSASAGSSTLLMAAAYLGCFDIAAFLVVAQQSSDQFNVDEQGLHGMTALQVAAVAAKEFYESQDTAARRHKGIIDMLATVEMADVNIKHKFAETTALHMAAEVGSYTIIPALCKFGANTSAVTATGATALHVAAQSGSSAPNIHALIEDCGIDVNVLMNGDTTPLYLASQHGHVHTVKALLANGADVNYAMPLVSRTGLTTVLALNSRSTDYSATRINSEAGNGATALHTAAEEGHAAVVRELVLTGKADINSLAIGTSALHLAVQYKRKYVVKELIALGANLDILSQTDGATAIYYAAGSGQDAVVQMLAEAGASLTKRSVVHGGFPLLYAALRGHKSTVELLLTLNASMVFDRAGDNNHTPFLGAVAHGHAEIARVIAAAAEAIRLPARQAILYDEGPVGHTALHMLAANGNGDMLTAMRGLIHSDQSFSLQDKIDFATQYDDNGLSALHLAVSNGHFRIVEKLVELVASLQRKNDENISRLHLRRLVCPRADQDDEMGPNLLYLAVVRSSAASLAGDGSERAEWLQLIQYLLSIDCETDIIVTSGKSRGTPLLAAVERNDHEIVASLLRGATMESSLLDIIAKGKRSNPPDVVAHPDFGIKGAGLLSSPLLLATARGYHKVVDELLRGGANCNIVVQTQQKPHYASPAGIASKEMGETLVDISVRLRHYDTTQVLGKYSVCDRDNIFQQL